MKRWAAVAVVCAGILAGNAWADIKNWQTGQTIPGTENITPGPSINLSLWNTSAHNLKYADLKNCDLNNSIFQSSWFDYADFTNSNLTSASFSQATGSTVKTTLTYVKFNSAILTNADLSGAGVIYFYAILYALCAMRI